MTELKPVLTEPECHRDGSHEAHMELNGECPWCGGVGESDPALEGLTDDEAVALVVKRHG